jgi:hypothetical protein
MKSVNKTAAIVSSCLVLALILLAPSLRGDESNLMTRFTVNQPFEVPHLVLEPNTPYVMQLYDSPAERHVVQIYNSDRTKLLTTFFGVSAERREPADKTVFTFIETEPGFPMPMKEWFYPGRIIGLEFIYPKQQAMKIARHAREPILSASSSDLHDLNSLEVEAVGPVREATQTTTAANMTKSETTTVAEEKPTEPSVVEDSVVEDSNEIAQNNESVSTTKSETDVYREKPTEAPAVTEQSTTEPELPHTAGELPTVALLGALCLGAGLGMRVLSSRQ